MKIKATPSSRRSSSSRFTIWACIDTSSALTGSSQTTIFGFSNAPDFIRGDVVSVSGTSVTLGSGDDNEQSDLQAGDDSEDGESNLTVDLADVPLALNGSSATPADLTAGDKIILLGTTDPETGQFTPAVAFAFNSSDNNPVGDNNDQGDDNSQD